jgi:hypothetical protein
MFDQESTMGTFNSFQQDQANNIRTAQRKVQEAYAAVSRGDDGAVARYTRANSLLAEAHQNLYAINAGLVRKDK